LASTEISATRLPADHLFREFRRVKSKVQPQQFTAVITAGFYLVSGLMPAHAVSPWVPLPTSKASALQGDESPGDPDRGKAIYGRCSACHQTDSTGGHRVGPALPGVVGRPAAAYEDFDYSSALRQAGKDGLIWSRDLLAEYLEAPSAFLPEGSMAFVGLTSHQDRLDLIAYLATIEAPKDAPWLFVNLSRASIPLPDKRPGQR
jgi:cytochrome c